MRKYSGLPVKHAFGLLMITVLFGMTGMVPDTGPPSAELTNGLIKLKLYLPDAQNGYYRATRFDWSGVISDLEYKGHSFYGKWFERYDPLINDAIMGPVEAFDPVGYDEAKAGEPFIKIGVGVLTKPDNTVYSFQKLYPLTNGGAWKTRLGKGKAEFVHTLNGGPYGYRYTKRIKLLKGKPVMTISHTLKNTGSRTIKTSVFNHNFFVIDKQPTGPGFVLTLPAAPEEKLNTRMADLARVESNQLVFLKELGRRNVSFLDMTGGKGTDYRLTVENTNTGAGARISADRRISKLVFWSAGKTVCPEPYIDIEIKPGEKFTWEIRYEYYSTKN